MQSLSANSFHAAVDTFDEETCRYVLLEIGKQIVPFYPFSFGIEEVYILLLDRYGEIFIADALSVLYELMEAEDNASGLGDDGDIWRSWRHSWRHRNVDPTRKLVATVRGTVLPSPTSQTKRRARAASFSAWSTQSPQTVIDELPAEVDDESMAVLERLHQSPYGCTSRKDNKVAQDEQTFQNKSRASVQLHFCESSDRLRSRASGEGELDKCGGSGQEGLIDSDRELDSQQDFEEVRTSADSINFDQSQLISFEMLTSPSDLRGGDVEFRTLRPLERARNCDESPLTVRHRRRISQKASCQVSGLDQMNPMGKTHDGRDTVQTRKTLNSGYDSDKRTEPPWERVVINQDARLIDGAIFSGHRGMVKTVSRREDYADGEEAKKTRAPVRQKEPLRDSLVKNIRGLLRKDQPDGQQQTLEEPNNEQKRTSSLAQDILGRGCDMVLPITRFTGTKPKQSALSRVPEYAYGIDGTCEEEFDQSRPYLNLNKALPESPSNIGIRNTSSSCTGTPSFDLHSETPIRPSTASSVSSGLSTKSSKRDFRGLTRALINDDMTSRRHDLSPVCETENLPASKYDPRKSMQSSVYSEHSYHSMMNKNPFTEDPVPLAPSIPLSLSVRKNENMIKVSEPSRMSPSPSRPDIQDFAIRQAPPPEKDNLSSAPRHVRGAEGEYLPEVGLVVRGRSLHCSPGPQRQLNGQKTAAQSQKRSRSPVKKLLGFGKSSSLKDIAGEPQWQSKNNSPDKSRTTPIRSLGNRLRHGFLTTDSDSAQRLHEPTSPSRRVTPSIMPQSTFPISLDPPYQAKTFSELELMLCVTANRFLMHEYTAGRLSEDSISKIKYQWTIRNRPQVLEFSYDLATQRDLVVHNLQTVHFHGECGVSGQVLHATLHNWKILASEVAVRTFCAGDSAIRKQMHDSHKILEMLGATSTTVSALADLQIKTLAKINTKQLEREERNKGQETTSRQTTPSKTIGIPAPIFGHARKSSKGSIEVNQSPGFQTAYDAFENSRGGRMGKMMRDLQQPH